MAVMSMRDGLAFDTSIESDTAPPIGPILSVLEAGIDVHCLRHLTRGGLATVLVEIARGRGSPWWRRSPCPCGRTCGGPARFWASTPLYVACEGRFVAFLPQEAQRALSLLRAHPISRDACLIGHVEEGEAVLVAAIGARRPLDMLSGEQLPCIC